MDAMKPAKDPIFARMAEWRAALAAFNASDEIADPEGYETLANAERDAQAEAYATKPTTIAGVIALASWLATDEHCDDACTGDLALKVAISTVAAALDDIERERLE